DPTRAPLAPDEVKPTRVEGQADWNPFIDDAEFQRAWAEYLDLFLGKGHGGLLGSAPLSAEQKDAIEWRTQFDHFLEQIDDLRPAVGEPQYRYFYRMATGLTAALRVAPPGPDRARVLRRLVGFLG